MLITANLVATVLRFLLYRHWVFGQRRGSGRGRASAGTGIAASARCPARTRRSARLSWLPRENGTDERDHIHTRGTRATGP